MPKCKYKGKIYKASADSSTSTNNIYLNLEISAEELISPNHLYKLISYCYVSTVSGENTKTFSTDENSYMSFDLGTHITINDSASARVPTFWASDEVDFHRTLAMELDRIAINKANHNYTVTLNLVINDLTSENCTKDKMGIIGSMYQRKNLEVTYLCKLFRFSIKISNIIINHANLKYFEVLPAYAPNVESKITFDKCNIDKLYLHPQFNKVIFKESTAIVYSDIFVNKDSYVRKINSAQQDNRHCLHNICISSKANVTAKDIDVDLTSIAIFREYKDIIPYSFSYELNIELKTSQILYVNVLHNLCKVFDKNCSLIGIYESGDYDPDVFLFDTSEISLFDVFNIPRAYVKGYIPFFPTEDTTPLFSDTYRLINNTYRLNKKQI